MLLALTAAALAAAPPTPQPQPSHLPPVTRLEATSSPGDAEPSAHEEKLQLALLPDLRLTVNVAVGADGPFRFLVDTAADRSAVSRQLAAKLQLPRGRNATLHSVTGISIVNTAELKGLQVASRTLPEVNAPLLDAVHVGADGILGTDVLRSALVRFDFRERLLSIVSASRDKLRASEPGTIVVQARRRAGRLIITEAEIDGQRLTVVLDTGSEVSIGNEALRRALSRRGQLSGERPVTLGSVTGSTLPASYMQARRLDIDGVTLLNLGIAFAQAHTFKAMGIDHRPALLLGMNALQAFESLTIDMAARKLRFVMPPRAGRTGHYAARPPARVGG